MVSFVNEPHRMGPWPSKTATRPMGVSPGPAAMWLLAVEVTSSRSDSGLHLLPTEASSASFHTGGHHVRSSLPWPALSLNPSTACVGPMTSPANRCSTSMKEKSRTGFPNSRWGIWTGSFIVGRLPCALQDVQQCLLQCGDHQNRLHTSPNVPRGKNHTT